MKKENGKNISLKVKNKVYFENCVFLINKDLYLFKRKQKHKVIASIQP